MAQKPAARYTVKDPEINRVIQDLYDKLAQLQGQIVPTQPEQSQTQIQDVVGQDVVTRQRALDQEFRNALANPLRVCVTCSVDSGDSMEVLCQATSSPNLVIASASNEGATPSLINITFFVPKGYYYKVKTSGTVLLETWVEWL